MTILTIDLDTADQIDALYAIDKLSALLTNPDEIITALAGCAFDMADNFNAADEIYPQPNGSNTWHRHAGVRDAHLRRFGMLVERIAA